MALSLPEGELLIPDLYSQDLISSSLALMNGGLDLLFGRLFMSLIKYSQIMIPFVSSLD